MAQVHRAASQLNGTTVSIDAAGVYIERTIFQTKGCTFCSAYPAIHVEGTAPGIQLARALHRLHIGRCADSATVPV